MAGLTRLKRTLRPLRPVLLPVWRPLRPLAENGVRATWRAWRRKRRQARFNELGLAIRPVTKAEFDEVTEHIRYYRRRWRYMLWPAISPETSS